MWILRNTTVDRNRRIDWKGNFFASLLFQQTYSYGQPVMTSGTDALLNISTAPTKTKSEVNLYIDT